ncbi:MAG: pstS [Verrucomicrobia bacterium]|nr:pstS [Verrucomicrobiota bacterium]
MKTPTTDDPSPWGASISHARSGARTVLALAALLSISGLPAGAGQTVYSRSSPQRIDGKTVNVDQDLASYEPAPPLTGVLRIVGAGGTYMPSRCESLCDLWIQLFRAYHPSVQVQTAYYSTPSAPMALCEGTAQVGLMTREAMPSELYIFRNKVFKPMLVPVGGGSYTCDEGTPSVDIIVHRSNPLKQLTMPQLDAIYSKTRKRGYGEEIRTWGQLGLTGEWADKPIHVYGLQPPDGITNYIEQRILDGGEFREGILEQHAVGLGAPGQKKGMDAIAERVGEDPYGIGYGNRWNVTGTQEADAPVLPNIRVVALGESEKGPYSSGTFEDVASGVYPLSRVIYLAVNKTPGKPIDPLAKEFLRAVLSKEGQEAVARTVYLPLVSAKVRASLDKIE